MMTYKGDSNKIGILVLCNGIYPDWTGGAEIHIFELCKKLVERGFPVFVICPTPKLKKSSNTNSPFIRISIKLWPTPFNTLSFAIKSFAKSFGLRQHIDIIHTNTADSLMPAAFLFSLVSRKPYIVVCHGSEIRLWSRKFFYRIFQIPFLYNAKRIFTVSNEIAEILLQKYPIQKSKILIIGNAYNDTFIQELRKTKLHAGVEGVSKIICVANMLPEKDHLTLLKGFKKVIESVDNVQLLLVGEGPLKSQLEEFCIQYGLKSVRFVGRLPHEDVLRHIADSDIFIMTSIEEGMPTVILEALALETPVVATAVGGIPELIVDGVNGLLVPPRSAECVAEALLRLLGDSLLRRKLGEAAADSVKDYSWSRVAEKYEIAYQDVLQQKK